MLSVGAVAGVLVSGRLTDRLMERGQIAGRLLVATAALSAPSPPLDAARLDGMPARLWGPAEGVRTVLRSVAQAVAPLVFGFLSD